MYLMEIIIIINNKSTKSHWTTQKLNPRSSKTFNQNRSSRKTIFFASGRWMNEHIGWRDVKAVSAVVVVLGPSLSVETFPQDTITRLRFPSRSEDNPTVSRAPAQDLQASSAMRDRTDLVLVVGEATANLKPNASAQQLIVWHRSN